MAVGDTDTDNDKLVVPVQDEVPVTVELVDKVPESDALEDGDVVPDAENEPVALIVDV